MEDITLYLNKLSNSILKYSPSISKVQNLVGIKIFDFNLENLKRVNHMINNNLLNEINKINNIENKEYNGQLVVVKFNDSNNNEFIGTLYDSDELWQNPEVIEIYQR